MFPRWLPLYLLGIAALTLFPYGPPACDPGGWVMRWGRVDFIANLVAFIPIGLVLHRSSLLRTVLLAFALSLTIELSQYWLPRMQDATDLISNTLGAAAGHTLARAWKARWPGPLLRAITRRTALIVGTPVLLIAAAIESTSIRANDFSNWHPYPLVIGNTVFGDRPWMGEISDVAIFDRALQPGETVPSEADPTAPALWAEGGPILWLHFGEQPSGRIDGPAGPVRYAPEVSQSEETQGSGLNLVPSGLALDPWASEHVVERLREASELTLDVRLRPRFLHQHGPARIVSIGDGGRFRNLMLAQQSSAFLARIRTPANGRGGTNSEVRTHNGAVNLKDQNIRLTYDGSHALLFVDGVCEDSAHMALANAHSMLGPFLGVTIVVGTAWPALATASFARSTRRRFVLAAAGALAAWHLLWLGGAWDHLPNFTSVATVLGIFAFVALLPMLPRRKASPAK